MEWIRLDSIVSWILRLGLASLFATAAMHKIRDLPGFRDTLANYQVLPRPLLIPVSVGLVIFEVAIAVDLVTGLISRNTEGILRSAFGGHAANVGGSSPWAGATASALLVVYGLAIAINLLRGRNEIDCGCLGPTARQPLSAWLLVRNGLLASGAALTSLPLSERSLHVVDGITLIGGLIILSLLYYTASLLASTASRSPGREGLP